jgi:hypothetical protein
VADQKPPRLVGDERATLQALLQYQRDSVVRKVTGVDEKAARLPMVGTGTSLLWIVKHLAGAETTWALRRFAGLDVPVPDDRVGPADSVAGAVATYRATSARVDSVLASSGLDDLAADAGPPGDVNLRWVLAHLLEETARHAGHADILREQLDGSTGR